MRARSSSPFTGPGELWDATAVHAGEPCDLGLFLSPFPKASRFVRECLPSLALGWPLYLPQVQLPRGSCCTGW